MGIVSSLQCPFEEGYNGHSSHLIMPIVILGYALALFCESFSRKYTIPKPKIINPTASQTN